MIRNVLRTIAQEGATESDHNQIIKVFEIFSKKIYFKVKKISQFGGVVGRKTNQTQMMIFFEA